MAQKPENLITYAKSMRKDPTPAEAILWRYLRSKRFGNIKFRRQHPIPPYIVDFFCAVERLVIELDGESHIGKEAYDAQRQLFLEQQGLTGVYNNSGGRKKKIDMALKKSYPKRKTFIFKEVQCHTMQRIL